MTEIRLMRITWNTNNWEIPSGHYWSKTNQGKTNIAHENQYGYGHEEWLFNARFKINGFQYGYLRGVDRLPQNLETIDKVYLYTINTENLSST